MMGGTDDHAVFTIGHGDRSFRDLERRLQPHRVQTIVDVRSIPYSRHAIEFTKAELEAIAAEAGLGYRWMGDQLGGRPEDPALQSDGEPDVRKIVSGPRFVAGIAEVLALSRTSRVALLCGEVDHRLCHRATLIAPALQEAGVRVWHIDGDGHAVAHQPEFDW